MSKHIILTDVPIEDRQDLIRYASVVSGDEAGAEDIVQDASLRLANPAARHPSSWFAPLLFGAMQMIEYRRFPFFPFAK